MAGATVTLLSKESHNLFIDYYNNLQRNINTHRGSQRQRFAAIDKQYQREVDLTEEQKKAKAANRMGDVKRLQNMPVPVIMPQVESFVTYQTSVFLTGHPLFGVVASPTYIDEALQLESKIENDADYGGWTQELILFFRDCAKYEFAPVEVSWNQEVTAEVTTNLETNIKTGTAKKTIYSGNKIKRLDPYNTFVDTRVEPSEVYKKGEFGGYTEVMSHIMLKDFIANLPDKQVTNITEAFASGGQDVGGITNSESKSYYTPIINPELSELDGNSGATNWIRWAKLDDNSESTLSYKDSYEVTTLYCRILPSLFKLKGRNQNTPQIYKLVIVNHSIIIYAELQTNAHNWLPVVIGSPLKDGLKYQTKSLGENAAPFQDVATALMASNMAARRRAISDRCLYDPSRIDSATINSANPSAKMPVRPSAYGSKLSDAVYAFPFNDDQASISMQQIQATIGLANVSAGQNQAQQGQFVKGNKTLREFEEVMQNANGRDQLASILLEHQCFMPIKRILKLNVLQYEGGTTVYNRDKNIEVEIDPVKLRKAVLNFKISDGLVPSSKLLNSDSFSTALQVLGSSPQLANEYNLGPMFSYMMKTQGANLADFEKSQEQVAYEQAVSEWRTLASQAIDKGLDTSKLPPQPLPKDFNYDPAGNTPKPKEATTATETNQELL